MQEEPIVDIIILTVLAEEYKAVCSLIANLRPSPSTSSTSTLTAWQLGEVQCTKASGAYRVAVGMIGSNGSIQAALVTLEAVRKWKARYIFSVGIAGGISQLELGDVIIADLIHGYEYGKIKGGGFQPHDNWTYKTDSRLLDLAKAYASGSDWLGRINTSPPTKSKLKAVIGEVASGDKVISDQSDPFFINVLQKWPKIKAVDMESVGIGNAIEQAQSIGFSVGFMVIKGISDLIQSPNSSGKRSDEERDSWKSYAACTAAAFTIGLIANGLPIQPTRSEANIVEDDHLKSYREKMPIELPNSFKEKLAQSVVRVFDDGGQIVGAGFLIDDKRIFTSAHVIAQAMGRKNDFPTTAKAQVGHKFHVDFPFIEPREIYIAKNSYLAARNPEGGSDRATLELINNPPKNAKPISLLVGEDFANKLWGHRFWAYVPSGKSDPGDWIYGTLLGPEENRWLKVKIESIDTFGPVLCGTPIWDAQWNCFIGMGIELASKDDWTGYIAPSDYLVSQHSVINKYGIKFNDIIQTDQKTKTEKSDNKAPGVQHFQEKEELKQSPIGRVHGASNDRTAKEDQLGFKLYARAFAELIESHYTHPPLTIGIYGSWGQGKSTLLDYIEREVHWPVHVIRFNAWEYNSAEAIWPGLVRKIMDHMENELSFGGMLNIYTIKSRRFFRRFLENSLILGIILFVISFIIIKFNFNIENINAAFWGLSLSALVTIIIGIINIWFSPLSRWFTLLFKDNAYGKQIGYMEDIHQDIERLQDQLNQKQKVPKKYLINSDIEFMGNMAYKNKWKIPNGKEIDIKERILVIIDDLDRCEPSKAVEVLQAINLLLNFDIFIICLGIDARIVTHDIEMYYKKLLGQAGASGYEYLEKIIQIPFRIPEPSIEDIKEFISHQIESDKILGLHDLIEINPKSSTSVMLGPIEIRPNESITIEPRGTSQRIDMAMRQNSLKDGKIGQPMKGNGKTNEAPKLISETFSEFEELEKQSFLKFVPYMRPNPRHIKRLINIYRLVRMLAIDNGDAFIQSNPSKVIRWLLICGQWPFTAYRMLFWFDNNKNKINIEMETGDILGYLYKQCQSETATIHKKRNKLDFKLDLLESLINWTDDPINEDNLKILRRYTLNFNPAIETEIETEAYESGEHLSP